MRTVIFILLGLVFMCFAMWLTKPAQRTTTAGLFTILWLLVTGWNLYIGMSHGYSLQEEIPFQSAIFLIPVIGAWLLAIKGRKR